MCFACPVRLSDLWRGHRRGDSKADPGVSCRAWGNQPGAGILEEAAELHRQGGHYRIHETRGDAVNLIRIEAEGYQPAVSREIKSDEGAISINFELKRGAGIIAKVVTPRNLPAAGAKVALGVPGSQIGVTNGEISDIETHCARETTDNAGGFHFPPQDKDFQLVITHPSGFAHIRSTPEWI